MAGQQGVRAGRAFIEVFLDSSRVQAGLKRMGARFKAAGASLARVGGVMVAGSVALAAPVVAATKVYADFDDAMRRVEARSGGTADEMAALRVQAKELGRTTSSTATQVANMMSSLAQKGFNRSQIAQMIPNVRNLAQAAGTGNADEDATVSADLISGSMRAWKLEASESGRVADVFAAAVNNSNYTLAGLMESLKSAGPIARRYGIDLETTVATLAGMTNVNIDAASAGVAFRNMLLNASNAAKRGDFNKALEEAGKTAVTFVDASGNLRSLPAIMDDIGRAMQGMGSAEAGEILEGLFGKRTIVGAGAVADAMGDTAGGFSELNAILYGVDDTARKTAETMDAGLGGTLRRAWSAVMGMAIAVGETLSPALIRLEPIVTRTMGVVTGFIESMPGAVPAIAAVAAGIGAAGFALIGMGALISGVGMAISGVAAVAGMVLNPLGALAAVIGLTSAAVAGSALYEMWKEGAFAELGEEVTAMAQHFKDSFHSIASAIEQGELGMAFEMATLELQIQWHMLLDALEDEWKDFLSRLPSHAWKVFKKMPGGLQMAARMTSQVLGLGESGGTSQQTTGSTIAELERRLDELQARTFRGEQIESSEDIFIETSEDLLIESSEDIPTNPFIDENGAGILDMAGLYWGKFMGFAKKLEPLDMAFGGGAVGGFDVASIQQGLAPTLLDENRKQTNHLRNIDEHTAVEETFTA